jgi:hypothetical protein
MALFITSYSPTTSPLTAVKAFASHHPADETAKGGCQRPIKHNNFVRLLQHAAVCKTPILPLTWEPAFEKLGLDGAMGTVGQNVLNASVSLAFKRFRPHPANQWLSEAQFRDRQYEAMIVELSVFSRAAVLRHPNIAEFVGLCFELVSVKEENGEQHEDEVWPVLVLVKYNQGTLDTFIDRCDPLDGDTMIKICGEVAKGLSVLHRSSMIGPPYRFSVLQTHDL